MCRILLVDDNARAANATATRLQRDGHDVSVAYDGSTALRVLYEHRPDLVVLELVLPGIDGFEVCRLIRTICDVPILVLTGLNGEQDVVRGLDLGADQYVVKPIGLLQLGARIQAVLRRARPDQQASTLRTGDVVIDVERHTVTKRGDPVSLTPTEFCLLQALVERAGRVAPHSYLLERVWGPDWGDDLHCLRLYVGYLRQKLEDDPRRPRYILNEWGTGYRLVTDVVTPVRVGRGSV